MVDCSYNVEMDYYFSYGLMDHRDLGRVDRCYISRVDAVFPQQASEEKPHERRG